MEGSSAASRSRVPIDGSMLIMEAMRCGWRFAFARRSFC